MRERIEFLQKLGLSIDDMNEYPLMLGCSVRKNIVLHASVVVELAPVVRFLRGLDVERQDVPSCCRDTPSF
ncbi:unnamed protein product [Spirodela intermedia]|uniref:Uncharacterized protein n=1 Tax=Spirodela intermedia TaxID=51605 RepID=A0ABN7ECB8_SPIIN|nr:unnamed protein product [Spirodela intermedia]